MSKLEEIIIDDELTSSNIGKTLGIGIKNMMFNDVTSVLSTDENSIKEPAIPTALFFNYINAS